MPTLALFVILWIPLGLVENYTGLLVRRFLAGFFGSSILAIGAPSYVDLVVERLSIKQNPY